jgi:hypothetical protein
VNKRLKKKKRGKNIIQYEEVNDENDGNEDHNDDS